MEWKAHPTTDQIIYADPLTHTMGTSVELRVKLVGLPSGLAYDLVGEGEGSDLDFRKSDVTGTTIDVTAQSPLANEVGQIEKPISWSLIIDGWKIPLRDTQNMIYVTYDEPDGGGTPTEKRVAWITNAAQGKSNTRDIVAAIHAAGSAATTWKLGKTPETVWKFLDDDEAECIDHVKLIRAAVKMLGVPFASTDQIGFVFPSTNGDIRGVYSSNKNNGFQWRLINAQQQRLAYEDGGRNAWEAVLKFNGKYYGGFASIYDSTYDVMTDVAEALSWWEWNKNNGFGSFIEIESPSWIEE